MKVYVVDEFIRSDKDCEHQSGILGVFDSEEAAIEYAKEKINNTYSSLYSSQREDEPEGILKYYCCLDNNPECDDMYADYLVITVTEHELNKSLSEREYYRVSIFEDIDRSFPSLNNHKEIFYINREKAIKELNKRFESAKDYFEQHSLEQDGELTIEKDDESFHIFDDTSTIMGRVNKINFEDMDFGLLEE